MSLVHIRVWEYEVPEPKVGAFIAAYGESGDWAQLFGQAEGYLGTDLYRGTGGAASRFVTVDRWTSAEAWSAFLEVWADSYQRLDAALADLSSSQHALIEGTSSP